MAAILYAWELGANLGHVGSFLPVARELRQRGTHLHWAVASPAQAARLLSDADFDWLQAPQIPELRRETPPLNYADILLRFGYANHVDLFGLVVAWRQLMRITRVDAIVVNHAPTAILAARTLGLPVMLFGSGFLCPPRMHPTPGMRPWMNVANEELLRCDRIALTSINAVLDRYDSPRIGILADLFQVAEDGLLSFPELDHYRQRGPARYWGMLPAAVAGEGAWPAAPGPKVFSYLRPETPYLDIVLQTLRDLRASVLIYAPGLPADLIARYSAAHIRFSSAPVDLKQVARHADAGLTYASHATTAAFLLAGKPVMMLPGHLEQFLLARRVEDLGAGLAQNPELPPDQLAEMFHRVLNEPGFRNHAAGFARKYADFDQDAVLANIVARIESLINAKSDLA